MVLVLVLSSSWSKKIYLASIEYQANSDPFLSFQEAVTAGNLRFEKGAKNVTFSGNSNLPFRLNFPNNQFGLKNSGAKVLVKFSKTANISMKYTFKMPVGFNCRRGGKLPGLCSGTCPSGGKHSQDWSLRLMWRKHCRLVAYVYHPGKVDKYGVDFPLRNNGTPIKVLPGNKVDVELAIIQNSQVESKFTIKIDKKIVLDSADFNFYFDQSADKLFFTSFFGGHDSTWAPMEDTFIDFSNFYIEN